MDFFNLLKLDDNVLDYIDKDSNVIIHKNKSKMSKNDLKSNSFDLII